MFAFKTSTPFPGWRAMLPVGGTVLLIAAGPNSSVGKTVLAHPVCVFIGLISYPLYLWHWPLISIPEIVGQTGPLIKLTGVAVSFALASATYRFVERPIRRSANTTAIVLLAVMTVVGGTGWLAKREIFKPRANSAALNDILRAHADWVSPPEAAAPVSFENQTFWKIGASKELALIIGDSNAEQYFPRAQELVSIGAARLSPVFAFQGACIPIPDVAPIETPTCSEFIAAAFRFAARPEVKTVVVAGWFYADSRDRYHFSRAGNSLRLDGEPGRAEAFAALHDRLSELRKLGKRTVVVTSIPVGEDFSPKARLQRSLLGGIQIVPPPPVTMADVLKGYELTDRAVRAAAAGSELVDPTKFLCNPQCRNADDTELPIYKDATHLRAGYVRRHADFIDDIFQ
jgi:SGNH domain-containing protein